MELRQSAEDYLETMLILKEKHGYIRSVDIAKHLSVSKPSVSFAVKRLRENGYIEMDFDGLIRLTDSGLAAAANVYERHMLLSKFLIDLGVDKDVAAQDACKIEHDISEESFNALKSLANSDRICTNVINNNILNMDTVSQAMHMLNSLGTLTVDMHEAFVRGNVSTLFYCSNEAILLQQNCGLYMLWAANKDSGLTALRYANDDMDCCVAHGKASLDAISEFKPSFTIDPPCLQYCLATRALRPLSGIANIRPLRVNEAEFVVEHYAMEDDIEHVRNLIHDGKMFGAEVDGELAAFIGFHRDGSSGMLEVMPEFRRKGIGTELETFFQNYQLEKGWMPYGHVYLTNTASLKMQSKLGLAVSADCIWWVFDESEDND